MPAKRKPPVIGVEKAKRTCKQSLQVEMGDKLIPEPCEDPLQDLIEEEDDLPRSKKCDS